MLGLNNLASISSLYDTKTTTSVVSVVIPPVVTDEFLLLETGDYILLENGDRIILE